MRKIIGALIILAALIAIAVFLDTTVFAVRDFVVVGVEGEAAQNVVRVSGVKMGSRIRKVDCARALHNVEQSGEYRCLGVTTELPDTVRIEVEARVCVAATEINGNLAQLDQDGYVIRVGQEMPENALYVTGLSARDAVPGTLLSTDASKLAILADLVDALNVSGAWDYVSEFNAEDQKDLYIYSRTGMIVHLGDGERLESKLVWMKAALADLEASGRTSGHLDVSSGRQADYRGD